MSLTQSFQSTIAPCTTSPNPSSIRAEDTATTAASSQSTQQKVAEPPSTPPITLNTYLITSTKLRIEILEDVLAVIQQAIDFLHHLHAQMATMALSDPRRANTELWQIMLREDERAEIQKHRDRLVEKLARLERMGEERKGDGAFSE